VVATHRSYLLSSSNCSNSKDAGVIVRHFLHGVSFSFSVLGEIVEFSKDELQEIIDRSHAVIVTNEKIIAKSRTMIEKLEEIKLCQCNMRETLENNAESSRMSLHPFPTIDFKFESYDPTDTRML